MASFCGVYGLYAFSTTMRAELQEYDGEMRFPSSSGTTLDQKVYSCLSQRTLLLAFPLSSSVHFQFHLVEIYVTEMLQI